MLDGIVAVYKIIAFLFSLILFHSLFYSHIHIIMAAWTLIAGVVFCYFVFR